MEKIGSCGKPRTYIHNLNLCASTCKKCYISKGSYGKVVRGKYKENTGTEIAVAVKEIEINDIENVEVEVLQKIRHENIVRFYGTEQEEDCAEM